MHPRALNQISGGGGLKLRSRYIKFTSVGEFGGADDRKGLATKEINQMLTPLGKELRKLRIDRGWLLKDMASGIGVATSFLSGVETGRKAIPDGFVEKIAAWARIGGADLLKLKEAAVKSQREFKITVRSDFTDADREAAALLARFGDMPREKRDEWHALLKKAFP